MTDRSYYNVRVCPHVSDEDFNALLTQFGAHVTQDLMPSLNLKHVCVPDCNAEALMDALDLSEMVIHAERDLPARPLFIPQEEYSDVQTDIFSYVNAPQGWDITRGSRSIRAAILDTGCAPHPDLQAPRNFFNAGPLTDDDTVGHGTMCAGNFAQINGSGISGLAPHCGAPWIVKVSQYENGSANVSNFVSGIRHLLDNAAYNDGVRTISISFGNFAWQQICTRVLGTNSQPAVQIDTAHSNVPTVGQPVCVLDGQKLTFGVVTAVETITPQIYTASINWQTEPTTQYTKYVQINASLEDVYNEAWAAGFVVTLSAGNSSGLDINTLLGSKTLVVGNCTGNELEATSTRGPAVQVCAPGEDLCTTWPQYDNLLTATYTFQGSTTAGSTEVSVNNWNEDDTHVFAGNILTTGKEYFAQDRSLIFVKAFSPGDTRITMSAPAVASGTNIDFAIKMRHTYGAGSGTSFANPMVTALACLLFSANPALTNQQVKDLILSTATPLTGQTALGQSGAGVINVGAALLATSAEPDLFENPMMVPSASVSAVHVNEILGTSLDNGTIRVDFNANATANGGIDLITIRNTPDNIVRYRKNLEGFRTGRNVLECGWFGSFVDTGSMMDYVGQWNPVQGPSIDASGDVGSLLEFTNDGTTVYAKFIPNVWWGEVGSGVDQQSDSIVEAWTTLEGSLIHIKFKLTYTGPNRLKENNPYWPTPTDQLLAEMFYDRFRGETNGGPTNEANWTGVFGMGYTDDSTENITDSFQGVPRTVGYFGPTPWTGAPLYGADGAPWEAATTYGVFRGVVGIGGMEERVSTDEQWVGSMDSVTGYGVATYVKANTVYSPHPDYTLVPYYPITDTVFEVDYYRGYGNVAELRTQFQAIAGATMPPTIRFSAQPIVQSITSDGGVIAYGTIEDILGTLAPAQGLQAEQATGSLASLSDCQQTQITQSEEILAGLTFEAIGANLQPIQAQSTTARLELVAYGDAVQFIQSEELLAWLTFEATSTNFQPIQLQLITAQLELVASGDAIQLVQSEAMLARLAFEAPAISAQQLHGQSITARLEFIASGDAIQPSQSEQATASPTFSSSCDQSQTAQLEAAQALVIFEATVTSFQSLSDQSVTAQLDLIAAGSASQFSQSEVITARLTFETLVTSQQSLQGQSITAKLEFTALVAALQPIQAEQATAVMEFYSACEQIQRAQLIDAIACNALAVLGVLEQIQGVQVQVWSQVESWNISAPSIILCTTRRGASIINRAKGVIIQ